jgi:acyl-coenzyme A synthetase/AMP-(fatty) acid ligase
VFNRRLDNQVKFRGWRIELGDVEQALAAVDGTIECAAALISRAGKPDALAAFVRTASATNAPALLRQLRERLPEHMIPTHVRIVDDFPRTLNQKIDRARLVELL